MEDEPQPPIKAEKRVRSVSAKMRASVEAVIEEEEPDQDARRKIMKEKATPGPGALDDEPLEQKKGAKRKATAPDSEAALAELKAWIATHYPASPLADPLTCERAFAGFEVVEKPRPTGRHVDRYFITPDGKQLRSRPDVARHLGLSRGEGPPAKSVSKPPKVKSVQGGTGPRPVPAASPTTAAISATTKARQ